ncbi:MAG: cupredoxin domain-containing protein [Acidimicrobiales bacterium]
MNRTGMSAPAARLLWRTAAAAVALLSAGALSACGGDEPARTQAGAPVAGHGGASPVAPGARHIEVTARSFVLGPGEISAKVGEDLAIVLSSRDSQHDFIIDELGAHVAADAGSTAIGGFRATAPGRYAFYCSVAGHRQAGMEGVLVVQG